MAEQFTTIQNNRKRLILVVGFFSPKLRIEAKSKVAGISGQKVVSWQSSGLEPSKHFPR